MLNRTAPRAKGQPFSSARMFALGVLLFTAAPFFTRLHGDPSDDETNSFKAATQSYHDGAFDLADQRATALLKKFPKTELLPQVELLDAQALYQLGRSDDALAAFTLPIDQVPENLRSDTLFWQAESLLDLERWSEAEQKYRALLPLKNSAERSGAANLGLAWALFKQGKESEAIPLVQTLIKGAPNSPAAQRGQLLLAKIQLAHGQFKEAIAGLQALLGTHPDPGTVFEADYWLGQAYSVGGQPDLAVATYQKVTGDLTPATPPAPPVNAFPRTLVAQAFLGLGRAEQMLHQDDQAMLAYGRAYELTENSAVQMQAFRAFLEAARASRQLPEAVAKLQEFAKSSNTAAPAALLAIGEVLAEDRQDDKAIGILESLLVAYGKSSWAASANYQLGSLYARSGKPGAATAAFQNCITANADPAQVRASRFELGLVLLNQVKDAAGAAAQFSQISAGTDAAAESASYNFLLAQAALGKTDLFLKSETDFNRRFPKSTYLKKIALAQGSLLTRANQPDDAKAAYEKAIGQPGSGPDQKALLKAMADLQYQTGDLAGTVKTCGQIVSQFPDDSLGAAQRAILVSYEMKKASDEQTEHALVQLAQKYAKSADAPEAWFRLGEFYFYRQDYVKAQDAFQQLTTAYPSSPQAAEAYYFAGRAAAAHLDYGAALPLLDKVPETSPFKPEAQIWQARVYQQQLNFVQACAFADSVLTAGKSSSSRSLRPACSRANASSKWARRTPRRYRSGLRRLRRNRARTKQGRHGGPAQPGRHAQPRNASSSSASADEAMKTVPRRALRTDGRRRRGRRGSRSELSWQVEAGVPGRACMRESEQGFPRRDRDLQAARADRRCAPAGIPRPASNKLRRDNYIY